MEKYGFIYIWRDRKHNRYYIGSHWGTEDDGYICSSRMMRQAYRRRPNDFKRRIIERVYTDRQEVYDAENKWLLLAEKNKDRYYNQIFKAQHWSAYPENVKTISEKISHSTKEAMQRDDVRANYLEGIKDRDTKSSDPKVRSKRAKTMKETMAKKFPVEKRKDYNSAKFNSKEYKQKMAESVSKSWEIRDKKEIGKKISQSLLASKEQRSKYISELKWWNNGQVNRRSKECPGSDFVSGVLKKN